MSVERAVERAVERTVTEIAGSNLGSAAAIARDRRVNYLANLVATVTQTGTQTGTQDRIDRPADLAELRSHGAAVAQELGIPSTRDEDWRFTDVSPLLDIEFRPASPQCLIPEAIAALTVPDSAHLVFINGHFAPESSSVAGLPDTVRFGNWRSLAPQLPSDQRDQLRAVIGSQATLTDAFSALNTASLEDVAVVWVPRGLVLNTPVQLLMINTVGEQAAIAQPRCLVVAEANSALTLVEDYIVADRSWCQGPSGNAPYFTNAVTEIRLGDNAQVNHVRIQREARFAFHIGRTAVIQDRDSRYTSTTIDTGAALTRHNLDIVQAGPGTHTQLNGLAIATGQQVSDTHSFLKLDHPHASADQLHKCIISDRAHTVFNGRVLVGQAAQETDAAQLNRNLVLSPKARVDTKPQLEIIADNVKCTHGATVSQLEEEEVFYLRSRGLDAETSRNLLIDGFAGEIFDRLPLPSLRPTLARCAACALDAFTV